MNSSMALVIVMVIAVLGLGYIVGRLMTRRAGLRRLGTGRA